MNMKVQLAQLKFPRYGLVEKNGDTVSFGLF